MSVKSKDWVRCGDIPETEQDDMGTSAVNEQGRAYDIHKYFENDTCIHFHYDKGKDTYRIVYNKQTQAVYRYQSTVNDINCSFDSPVYNLFSVNSKFAYDWMYSNVVLSFLKTGKYLCLIKVIHMEYLCLIWTENLYENSVKWDRVRENIFI
jgi:hypothetical protein